MKQQDEDNTQSINLGPDKIYVGSWEAINPNILRHSDGKPKCVRSDYSSRQIWHYILKENQGYRQHYHVTLCGRYIEGTVVGDTYALDYGPEAGQKLPLCANCRKAAVKTE